jgi:hypothetical protein
MSRPVSRNESRPIKASVRGDEKWPYETGPFPILRRQHLHKAPASRRGEPRDVALVTLIPPSSSPMPPKARAPPCVRKAFRIDSESSARSVAAITMHRGRGSFAVRLYIRSCRAAGSRWRSRDKGKSSALGTDGSGFGEHVSTPKVGAMDGRALVPESDAAAPAAMETLIPAIPYGWSARRDHTHAYFFAGRRPSHHL